MAQLPDIPHFRDRAVLVMSLFPTKEWQKNTIIGQIIPSHNGSEEEGESLAPSLEWVNWARDDEGSRTDAYIICENARKVGWDHLFFVTGSSLAGGKVWLENKDEHLVLAFWESPEKSEIHALRVSMRDVPSYTGSKAVEALHPLCRGSSLQDVGISDLGRKANWEILKNPEGMVSARRKGQDIKSITAQPKPGSLKPDRSSDSHKAIYGLESLDSSDAEDLKARLASFVDDDVEIKYLDSTRPATRADLYRFMKRSRGEHGRPYTWMLFFADADSMSSETVYAALYEKSMATHAENVKYKRVSWEALREHWRSIDTAKTDCAALFTNMVSTSAISCILDPGSPICERNLLQECQEYDPVGDQFCWMAWATSKFTQDEEKVISEELSQLHEGVEDTMDANLKDYSQDARQDIDPRVIANVDEQGPKPHILVKWEADRPCRPEDVLAIYREIWTFDNNCVIVFADRTTLKDKTVIVTDWKDAIPSLDDEWEYEGTSQAVLQGKGILMGRLPGRQAWCALMNIQTSNIPFLDWFNGEQIMIVRQSSDRITGCPRARL